MNHTSRLSAGNVRGVLGSDVRRPSRWHDWQVNREEQVGGSRYNKLHIIQPDVVPCQGWGCRSCLGNSGGYTQWQLAVTKTRITHNCHTKVTGCWLKYVQDVGLVVCLQHVARASQQFNSACGSLVERTWIEVALAIAANEALKVNRLAPWWLATTNNTLTVSSLNTSTDSCGNSSQIMAAEILRSD